MNNGRIKGRIHNIIYRKFVRSFMMMVILPVIVFTFLYFGYFQKDYREEILAQAETSMDITITELQKRIRELQMIAVQNSCLLCTRGSNLGKDYRAEEIQSLLVSQVQTHTFIDNITFYNTNVKDRLYGPEGSFSPKYYRQYFGNEITNLILEAGMESGFYSFGKEGEGEDRGLWYVMAVAVRGYERQVWAFHIAEADLEKLLIVEGAYTLLYDDEGKCLYPYKAEKMKEGGIYLSEKTQEEELCLVREFDEKELLLPVHRSRNHFLASVLFIMVAGSVLALMLSSYNHKPIDELRFICEDMLPDIPETADGLEAFKFTLKKMEEKVKFLEERQKSLRQSTCDEEPESLAKKVIRFVDRNRHNPDLNVGMVANALEMSISNLSHQFKTLTGENISSYIMQIKFDYMRELLADTDYSVQKIAELGGYMQTASFIRKFKKLYGKTPLEYREYIRSHQLL